MLRDVVDHAKMGSRETLEHAAEPTLARNAGQTPRTLTCETPPTNLQNEKKPLPSGGGSLYFEVWLGSTIFQRGLSDFPKFTR